MNRTPIDWVKNPDGTQGYTFNPITGCLNGCEYCYARKLANGRLRSVYSANVNIPETIRRPTSSTWRGLEQGFQNVADALADPFYPRFWPERLKELEDRHTHNNRFPQPIGVFPCDMSDLFGIGVPEEWTRRVLDVIGKQMSYPALDDRFYLLTKQSQNLPLWSPFPDNCWVGVTATNPLMFLDATQHLQKIEAKVKYISIEPLLYWNMIGKSDWEYCLKSINWVIIGAQTCKSYWELATTYPNETDRIMKFGRQWTFQPKIEWVHEIIEAAAKAKILVFLKNNLLPLFPEHKGLNYPLRQEMPL